ncbi:MAG: hypothetical protein U0935_20240 [Pirellulales bacterium]
MRLTLRTLLAYLDDLLDASDAVEMGKRIDENKVATELVHRIRTRMRLLRLGAPKIDGKGIGVDPNSVAEYLDNTLPPERVLDFEKVCLESDVHLAEVASCHQILAAVLDKPAAVDTTLRLRMYNLIDLDGAPSATGVEVPDLSDLVAPPPTVTTAAPPRVSAPPAPSAAPPTPPPVSAASPAASGSSATGSASRGWLYLAVSLATVFLLVLGGLRALGPFDRTHPLASLVGASRTPGGDGREVARAGGKGTADDGATSGTTSATADSTGATAPGGATGPGETAPADKVPAGDAPAGDASPAAAPGTATPAAEPAAKPGTEAADGKPGDEGKPEPDGTPIPPPLAPDNGKPAGGIPGDGPGELGRFLSEEHLMVRRSPSDNLWYRLARGTRILDGDHLISLPVFRPQLLLTTGAQAMVVGEASLRFRGLENGETPELTIEYGRLLLASSGRPGSTVQLNLAGEDGVLRFTDVDAEAAVEVARFRSPGEDPLTTPPQVVVSISSRKGKTTWKGMSGEETLIASGSTAQFIPGGTVMVAPAPDPYWIVPPKMGELDRQASEQLVGFLRLDRPVTLSLEELSDFRKTEVRSLAARCLGVLGQFDALWGELGNDKQYSYWDEACDALRDAIARSEEDALEVRRSLDRQRKRQANDLFRLLRGYDPQQLAQGGAAQLVDFLDHEDLDLRVLAFENLRRITESTHNYRPEKPAEARKIQVQEWRKQLKEGRIVYKSRRTS